MKKILVPGVREECEWVCDVTGKPAVARLQLVGGYGSDFDGHELVADLSCEVASEIMAMLQAKYPQFKVTEYPIFSMPECRLFECHRAALELESMRKRARSRKVDRKAALKLLREMGPVDLHNRK